MVILFDAYMTYPELKQVIAKDIELKNFFFNITQFVMQRLEVLREQIDFEEMQEQFEEDKSKAIIIWVLPEYKNQITFAGYSKELRSKMLACFTKKDMDYFIQQQAVLIKLRNN